MKKVILLLVAAIAFTAFKIVKPTKIVFFGDSITQAAVGPKGFITLLKDDLVAKQKTGDYELFGAGIGGNKIYDLYLRFEEDVLSKEPDQVVIWVGVNDVWHKRTSLTGTDPDKFVKFYTALIKKFQAKNIKVALVTPAAIGEKTDYTNDMDGDLNKYAQFIRDLAASNNCKLIDLRKIFHEYALANNPKNADRGVLTSDGVHLNDAGNKLVADEMAKVIYAK
ncbi:SGNH/GDSL hydrolase family protein [Mucilaginibacter myungsuensis]|uniref:G-D-S-L family lipolytic protein n=1 Tax=Mucilaginibacter myungsuensis TaxID=649104 RepID=A0A929PXB7_9SPHI|nr:GDSL-type esterase/lipase family protein [Mucilaginibacter myungsuensis]MBE9663693.1 G-D-S-L family lipolytic protein [Mucilaginibacter myungsuensis]MDN3598983.1 GDSL-type esterase/lipase family protein [Mucilaginibacter myungsuensis]